ncbi:MULTISPECIES: hypothetical protein [Haloferax]|uniref:Uncharacterized protein n=1 Tax=Haloferax mediterranei (strain ATCC 33500 / DSM 1411 / JCM 8866 / NBRC 14739 / NCIMB 2177 / R-4) TaxID=523841 RepID=I3R0S1_HALMT|nr:hypothetical protein [Haloferax mediterranei]AFK17831.1 hypothetical protein HFX_0089 [Haloferax mediterranei ATCC 33500]EMA02896.1 hypothetical protein C439_09945 [Haloferax mediterranei ATCC 33500]MDX5987920.1 hypothetical protein [Haloferax mediterranei ATCC 33500]
MNSIIRGAFTIVAAAVVSFPAAFVLAPDPTGTLPIVAGIVLTGVVSLLVFAGMRLELL